MKTLNVIYVLRLVLGFTAALITNLVIDLKVGDPLISGISIGILFYIITYYILKWRFLNKVEKPSKIFTMGIGAYFLTFILFWVLFITPFLAPPTAVFTVDPKNPVIGEPVTFSAKDVSYDPDGIITKWQWEFGDGVEETGETTTHIYSSANDYVVTLRVVDDHGIGRTVATVVTVSESSS